jgi:predicted cobalt transporter CbtA
MNAASSPARTSGHASSTRFSPPTDRKESTMPDTDKRPTAGDIARQLIAGLQVGSDQDVIALAQVYATLAIAEPKPLPTVEFRRPDDERLELLVNGREVAWANHDEHGWSGMDAFEKAAVAIVKAFGGEIGEAEASDEDDA